MAITLKTFRIILCYICIYICMIIDIIDEMKNSIFRKTNDKAMHWEKEEGREEEQKDTK